jgi:hypothetical protein
MIKLKQPALALHACDTQGYRFQMRTSWDMYPRATINDVIYWILYARDRTPELMLPNVVIDCHGDSAKLLIGGEKIDWSIGDSINIFNVGQFSQLRGKDIGTIWLHSCWVAWPPAGPEFCQAMAIASGCNIVASKYPQHTAGMPPKKGIYKYPFGCIDNFEGPTYCWNAHGSVSQIGQDGSGAPGVD